MFARASDLLDGFGPWAEGPVVLACSGGADSTFLAAAWSRAQRERELPSALAVVVDHGHRADSATDAAAAAELLGGLGLEARVRRAACPADANEALLREARYALLLDAAREAGAARVLTAHHADDLAETVLLRILRGTGLRGLAGIPVRRRLGAGVELLRPLLGLRRAEMRAALVAAGIGWIEDPSNARPGPARNTLRHEVLPALARLATGDPLQAVLRLAGEAGEWNAALDRLLADADDWPALPGYLRRQALAVELRAVAATVSPARLRDLEGALLRRGQARIDRDHALNLSGGRLRLQTTPGKRAADAAD